MKQVKSFLKIFSLGLLLVGGAACTGNFDEINRKEYEVTKDILATICQYQNFIRTYEN